MKHLSKIVLPVLLATALLGAGCGQASPEKEGVTAKPAETSLTPVPPPAPVPEPASASTSEPTNPTSKLDKKIPMEKLAFPGVLSEQETNVKVSIKTTLGTIVVQIDPKAGPNAASNFVYLVKQGFYNGTIFHRVIPGFMIQGGDPTGTGSGGPGYQFANDPVSMPYSKGVLAMANAGRNTNGSQFFIMVDNVPLQPYYSVYGKVVSGQDEADAIAATPRNGSDRPNTEVKMLSVTIE